MKEFPDIKQWFDVSEYTVFNECHKLEINMKPEDKVDMSSFCKEFAKYLCRLRCGNEQDRDAMYRAVDGYSINDDEQKERIANCFFKGFISDSKYSQTGTYSSSFDDDAITGYIGECFYYIIREQLLEDEKIHIEPCKPKFSSKEPGIDFVEIRKDANGYYMIVGEIKTTQNSIGTRPTDILTMFKLRANKIFSEMYMGIKENYSQCEDKELKTFIDEMLTLFYGIKKTFTPRKRFSGVINYNYHHRNIHKSVFSGFKTELADAVFDSPHCRRIKLIGIYNIENIIRQVRDEIWSKL
ncbi:hypothetical protein Desde_0516 [Desulfitobacterium dehalogenans ATCC 51507]|uniref:Anti-bacteriophage protein A/HamA C-terminal domain-containing protein n=1 Tax=Desulfitobacterium dehalogenans (strain ATCC 51507 / DSM 9161 / JW/IU-DC1) TaxID=756499 RepID=I4A4U2_DESDJ|nr:hypothetical protein [Desulfitobacterium dehalogenans]AFL98976.1 hypothetical protein Desde_0516 [Desulfitobacterium dehalogenans ATCC 51507]